MLRTKHVNSDPDTDETVTLSDSQNQLVYGLNDTPPLGRRMIYSIQFLIIFFGSIVLIPSIVAGDQGWDAQTVTFILQCTIFTGGIATFVQAKGIGPVGSRLPIMLGDTFVIIAPLIAISKSYGFDSFLGAVIVAGLIYAVLGYFGLGLLRRIFSGAVSGALIVTISVSLAPTCADMMAGGSAPIGGYSSWQNWMLALITMAVCILCNCFGKGFIKTASLFFGLIAGYVVALFMGAIDFENVAVSGWVSIPRPFVFGISFDLEPILIMIVIYIVTLVELIGDTTATTMVCANRLPTKKELRGGILCDALSSVLAGVFNFVPNVSYSDGIGIIGSTKVGSRSVVVTTGILITLAGLLPKFAAVLYTVPPAVLGGATMFLTGVMLMSGFEVIRIQARTQRNTVIIGTSLAVGIGLGLSGVLENAPLVINILFSGIPGTALVGGLLNVVLPRDKENRSLKAAEEETVSMNPIKKEI